MSRCSIAGCDNTLAPHSRLRTCATCRQSLHKLEKKSPAQILERSTKLRKYAARTDVVATVKDGRVSKVDHDELEAEGIMMFPKRRAKRKANVIEFKPRAVVKRKAGGAR